MLAAIPAIVTLPVWGIVFSIVLLAAFFAMPWIYRLMPELKERVEHRVKEAWLARKRH